MPNSEGDLYYPGPGELAVFFYIKPALAALEKVLAPELWNLDTK